MINSVESDRLQNLIDRKTAQYEKLKAEDPDNKALLYLNSEITLLRDTIMPIVLCNTTVDYAEIRDFVTRSMRKLENHRNAARNASDLLIHFHIKEPVFIPKKDGKPLTEDPVPLTVYFSNIGHDRQFTPELFIDNKESLCYPL